MCEKGDEDPIFGDWAGWIDGGVLRDGKKGVNFRERKRS